MGKNSNSLLIMDKNMQYLNNMPPKMTKMALLTMFMTQNWLDGQMRKNKTQKYKIIIINKNKFVQEINRMA